MNARAATVIVPNMGRALPRLSSVLAVLALSVGAYSAVTALPASATFPDVVAPERVYTGVDQDLAFDGTPDPISGDTRAITADLADGAPCHTDTSSNSYTLTGCARVQLDLDADGSGKLFIPGSSTVTNVNTGNVKVIVAASGAIIDQATDS